MTPTETALLLTLIASYDRRTLGDEDVLAWHAALAQVAYADARTVVTDHYRTETAWIMPAHITAGVRRIRSERLTGLDALLPDADPDDVQAWLDAYRAQIADVADGRTLSSIRAIDAGDVAGVAIVVAALAEAKEITAQAAAREHDAEQAAEAERARQLAAVAAFVDAERAAAAEQKSGAAAAFRARIIEQATP